MVIIIFSFLFILTFCRCNGLILLETYTTAKSDLLTEKLPPFLKIVKEVTCDPSYSMYNLSLKAEWSAQNFQKVSFNGIKGSLDSNGAFDKFKHLSSSS